MSTGYKIPYVYFLYTEGISQKFYLHGSNSPTSYNDTNVNNRTTDSSMVFRGQVTPSSGTEMYIYNSLDAINLYRYVHLLITGTVGEYFSKQYVYSGSTTTSNFVTGRCRLYSWIRSYKW